jgi:hypothetical protein
MVLALKINLELLLSLGEARDDSDIIGIILIFRSPKSHAPRYLLSKLSILTDIRGKFP